MAVSKQMGTARSMAMAVTSSVPTIKGRKPKLPFRGCHAVPKSSTGSVLVVRIGNDLTSSPTTISRTSRLASPNAKRIRPVLNRSCNRRRNICPLLVLLAQLGQGFLYLVVQEQDVAGFVHVFLAVGQDPADKLERQSLELVLGHQVE